MLGEGRHGCLSAPLRFLSAARLKYKSSLRNWGRRVAARRAHGSPRGATFPNAERGRALPPQVGPKALRVTLSADSLCRLSLQTLSYMPRHLTARVEIKETAENKNETTRRREGKACARYAVAQRKRVHAISTLLLSAGSTGSSPHPAPCDVSVGCIQGFVDPRVRHRIGFYCSIRVRFLGTRSTVRVHEPYPC